MINDIITKENEQDSLFLFNSFSKKQKSNVFGQDVDISSNFMGFVTYYKYLSYIIPTDFTVVDLGSSCAAQSYFFRNHKCYISVDKSTKKRFNTDNGLMYCGDIKDFFNSTTFGSLDINKTFAICNYVPNKAIRRMVREIFPNCFCFYPDNPRDFTKMFNKGV